MDIHVPSMCRPLHLYHKETLNCVFNDKQTTKCYYSVIPFKQPPLLSLHVHGLEHGPNCIHFCEIENYAVLTVVMLEIFLENIKLKFCIPCYLLNRTLGLDLVVRDPEANIIDPDSTGVIELYRRVRSTKKASSD